VSIYAGLFYSYQTCGYLNAFAEHLFYKEIQEVIGETLRVSFPAVLGGHYAVLKDPSTGDLEGSVVELAKHMFQQPKYNMSIGWDVKEISAESREQHPQSLYTV
jgi:hypothetical protein